MSASRTNPDAPQAHAPLALDETDGLILRALADAGRCLLLVELADRSGRSERTCRGRVPALASAGLVRRLPGRGGRPGRRGVFITPAGAAALARLSHSLPRRDPRQSTGAG